MTMQTDWKKLEPGDSLEFLGPEYGFARRIDGEHVGCLENTYSDADMCIAINGLKEGKVISSSHFLFDRLEEGEA